MNEINERLIDLFLHTREEQDAADFTRQARIAVDEIAQTLGQDKHPLAVWHTGQELS